MLGGSSCLNYYTWVRGSKGTFDDWEEYGGAGWTWEGVKEYFDKVCSSVGDDCCRRCADDAIASPPTTTTTWASIPS